MVVDKGQGRSAGPPGGPWAPFLFDCACVVGSALWAPRGGPWDPWGGPWAPQGSSGAPQGALWAPMGVLWALMGPQGLPKGPRGPPLGAPGAPLGTPGPPLGDHQNYIKKRKCHTKTPLSPKRRPMGASRAREVILGAFWCHRGPYKGSRWRQKAPKNHPPGPWGARRAPLGLRGLWPNILRI